MTPDEPPVRRDVQRVHGDLVGYAEAGGPGERGGTAEERPVVVLVHGMASRGAQWAPVMARLAGTVHVLAPDLLGHGTSAKPRGDYSLGAHACGLRDLLASLGHERVTVVGHSLGGGIAMQFAYQFPERVERLALVCSGGLGPEVSPVLRAATLPGAEAVLPLLGSRWVRAAGARVGGLLGAAGVVVPPGVTAGLESVASLSDAQGRAAFLQTARAVLDVRGQRVDARDRLHLAAALPLLVVWGERDAVIPVAHGRDLAATVPGARLEVFARSGHFPHVTEPERFADVLADWVATTEPARLDAADLAVRLRTPRPDPA